MYVAYILSVLQSKNVCYALQLQIEHHDHIGAHFDPNMTLFLK